MPDGKDNERIPFDLNRIFGDSDIQKEQYTPDTIHELVSKLLQEFRKSGSPEHSREILINVLIVTASIGMAKLQANGIPYCFALDAIKSVFVEAVKNFQTHIIDASDERDNKGK